MKAKVHVKYISGNSFETEIDNDEFHWDKLRLILCVAKEIIIKPITELTPEQREMQGHIMEALSQPDVHAQIQKDLNA